MLRREQRLATAEGTIARLTADRPNDARPEGTTLTAPVRIVDRDGRTVLILSGDADGGHISLLDSAGRRCGSVGCHSRGGWIDILQTGEGKLAVTLAVNDDGGSIEITTRDGTHLVRGERCWPAHDPGRGF